MDSIVSSCTNGRPVLCISIFTSNQEKAKTYEPDIPSVSERLQVLKKAKEKGFITGILLSPLIPGINDSEKEIADIIRSAKDISIDFFLFDFFWKSAIHKTSLNNKKNHNNIIELLDDKKKWHTYRYDLSIKIKDMLQGNNIELMPPSHIFLKHVFPKKAAEIYLLSIYYYLLAEGKQRNGYKYAAASLSEQSEAQYQQLSKEGRLMSIKGIGPMIENFLSKMYHHSDFSYLEELIQKYKKKAD
jgi:hypothetical protein